VIASRRKERRNMADTEKDKKDDEEKLAWRVVHVEKMDGILAHRLEAALGKLDEEGYAPKLLCPDGQGGILVAATPDYEFDNLGGDDLLDIGDDELADDEDDLRLLDEK
jgi:hypothetical protein